MARYGAESATFGGVVFKRAKIWGGCFGYWKNQLALVFSVLTLYMV